MEQRRRVAAAQGHHDAIARKSRHLEKESGGGAKKAHVLRIKTRLKDLRREESKVEAKMEANVEAKVQAKVEAAASTAAASTAKTSAIAEAAKADQAGEAEGGAGEESGGGEYGGGGGGVLKSAAPVVAGVEGKGGNEGNESTEGKERTEGVEGKDNIEGVKIEFHLESSSGGGLDADVDWSVLKGDDDDDDDGDDDDDACDDGKEGKNDDAASTTAARAPVKRAPAGETAGETAGKNTRLPPKADLALDLKKVRDQIRDAESELKAHSRRLDEWQHELDEALQVTAGAAAVLRRSREALDVEEAGMGGDVVKQLRGTSATQLPCFLISSYDCAVS